MIAQMTKRQDAGMQEAVHILCAVRDRQSLRPLIARMDDGVVCTIDVVTTGGQALDLCRKAPPDILVADAVLPGMDGLGLVEQLQRELGRRMPRVIGGARTPFARQGFLRRGASAVMAVPWDTAELERLILRERASMEAHVDWEALRPAQRHAGMLLRQMGMHASLKGFAYLSCAAALAFESEARMFHVGRDIYEPLAVHYGTSKENVERLIRHAIESTMSAARAGSVYSLFGNTIDPAKGKPTNAHVIALLVQRMRVEKNTEQQIAKTASE